MAVNYANALAKQIDFFRIAVSRKEGALVNQIDEKCFLFVLNRKRVIDLKALLLRNYVRVHKVTVVHAHSTSFLAFFLKLICPSLK
jgi:hypothetical protein